ncbi:MAG: ParB/RepB/Spo0J family partition protein [Nitrospiria bacterium]
MKRKALGRGLGLSALVPSEAREKTGILEIDIEAIAPNRFQPRQVFDQKALESLAVSLKHHGLIQPIVVRLKENGAYELISGERRWRAARIAGFLKIPAIVKAVEDRQMMEWALLENLQREDLNPIEKAQAYERLISQFSLTQESIAGRMGIDRSSVSNFLRLLQLPKKLWGEIAQGRLTMGHAKALLSLDKETLQLKLALEIIAHHLSVRQAEKAAQALKKGATQKKSAPASPPDSEVVVVEDRLRRALGTKVRLMAHGDGGEIRITYFSLDDLERILAILS